MFSMRKILRMTKFIVTVKHVRFISILRNRHFWWYYFIKGLNVIAGHMETSARAVKYLNVAFKGHVVD